MLTIGLESLIGKGKAQYKTFTFGAGGAGRIPVPKGSFIVIIDFDYFHFVDNPDQVTTAAPAVSIFQFQTTETQTTVDWTLNGVPALPVSIIFDTANPLQAQVDFQTFLNANFPGFSVSITLQVIGLLFIWDASVTTTTPGAIYNGQIPVMNFFPPPAVTSVGSFAGGTAGQISLANLLKKSAHQLEFRSRKSRNHYVIKEDIEIFNRTPFTGVPNDFTYNVRGYYHRDTYLVHTETVQINIINISVPESWIVTYGASSQKSQEESVPVGYGQLGVVNLPTIQEAILNGVAEGYKPLTPEFTDTLSGAAQEQFKFNTSPGRELANPVIPLIDGYSNGRNYPTVNIGYVLINQDYNDYVKSS